LGKTSAQLEGTDFHDLVKGSDKFIADTLLSMLARHGRIDETEIRVLGPGGNKIPMKACGHSLGKSGHFYIALRSQYRMPGDDTVCDRDHDSGLYDGGQFHELAASRLKEMSKAGQDVSLTVLDVTGLERILASLPEEERETLLGAIGTLMKSNSIDGDTAANLGGEKFGFIAQAGQSVEALEKEVVNLVQTIAPSREVIISSAQVNVGDASEIDEDSLAKGLMYTFQSLQASGTSGLNDITNNMNSLVEQTVGQITAFRNLVTQRNFDVALHPIVSMRDGTIHHFEALCRFNGDHETSPFKAITFAEETGLIDQFDLSMAGKVIQWLSKQPRNNKSYRAAVNMSGFSISKDYYKNGIIQLLDANPWLEDRLIFEVTESSRMADLEEANDFIQTLRGRGFEVCLDDFGAGAASFQYLSVLEVDVVKLDGSAVKNAQKAAKGRAFLTSLTELCRKLKVETVAEMVDSPKALAFVRECGCDYVQGYLFGKPSVNVADFFPLPNQALLWGGRSTL
jgi:EAL domain-containing protein (putative c-di-GMP-specific phosphodiesterase class I)/GGDEF domain-containing protein